MIKTQKITSVQLLTMMFITKIFFFMMYTPRVGKSAENAAYLIGQFIALPFVFLSLIPFYYMDKWENGSDIISLSGKINKTFGKLTGVLYWLYMIFSIMNTGANFDFYLTAAVYPESRGWFFIIIIMLSAIYCASMGIEPLARFSGFVIFIVAVSALLIFIPLISELKLSYIHMPDRIKIHDFISTVYLSVVSESEFVLLYIFADSAKGSISKGLPLYVVIGLTLYEITAFFTVTVFGPYAETLMFPLYSLSNMTRVSILERTDSIHVIIWVFVAFVKISLFLIGSARILSRILPIKYRYSVIFSGIIAGTAAVMVSESFEIFHKIRLFMYTGVLFFSFSIVIPTVVLALRKIQKTRQAKTL